MDITLDKKSPTEATLKIKLEEADYQPKVTEKLKEYRRKANIKGFRPGMAPMGLIQKMYGTAVKGEEINQMLSSSLTSYIRENKLQVLGEPMPRMDEANAIDWNTQKDFEFTYDLGLASDFSYELSDKLKAEGYEVEIEDALVDETIDNLKEQFGQMENPEESEAGDIIYGEFKQKEGEVENTASLAIDDLKKTQQKNFIGLKKDDTVEFDIDKLFNKDKAEVKAQILGVDEEAANNISGEFALTVKNINRRKEAEINQEFFDKVFGEGAVEGEEAFRTKVRETIAENYNREAKALTNKKVQDALIESTNIELPDAFLKDWLLRSNEGKVSQEDIEREYDLYARELRWDLIQGRLAEELEVKVEHEEVMTRVKEMIVQQLGQSGLLQQMGDQLDAFAQNYAQSENGQNYLRVHNQVRSERIMDQVREKITLNNKKVSGEEFRKLASEN